MDQFKQAVNLARGALPPAPNNESGFKNDRKIEPNGISQEAKIKNVSLKSSYLESMRIVSHNKDDLRTRPFDMLRTQVLQSMDRDGWQLLAVTSPTPGCGKTVTACNLALSIARLPERSVLLVDLDMRKPKVANYLGVASNFGLLSVLQGRQSMSDTIFQVGIESEQILMLPGEQTRASSEWMASQTMGTLLETLKREFRSRIIILDLPPILAGDDVLSILPHLQSILLIAEAGSSSLSEVKQCAKLLKGKPIVRIVLNKIVEREATDRYYEYY